MLRKFCSAAFAAFLIVCAGPVLAPRLEAAASDATLPVHPEPLVVETKGGERSFTIEVADDPAERERGLMFRESMADDHGMLFVFERERDVGFWMKNTPMPLDLIFISGEGTIKAIRRGQPFSESLITAGLPVRFVLELKAGTALANGIATGDKVRHKVIAAGTVE
jgi:uncharacterized membrane protein (UPF0127 family)